MARLKYGDKINIPNTAIKLNKVSNVVPIKFDTIDERWVVCAQKNATHMMIEAIISDDIDTNVVQQILIEIGKCENIYLLADAIVD